MKTIKKMEAGLYFMEDIGKEKIEYKIREGLLKRITKGIYISAKDKEEEKFILKTKLFDILDYLFPNCYISDSSAIYLRPVNNFIFLRGDEEKKIKIGDFTVFINKKESYIETNKLVQNKSIQVASIELTILENLIEPKFTKERIAKEDDLIMYIRNNLNSINLDKIDLLSEKNKLLKAKSRFFQIYGKLKGSKPFKEEEKSLVLRHLSHKEEIDLKRIELFTSLSLYFKGIKEVKSSKSLNLIESSYKNYCFYDSYFSNYIEGSRLLMKDAREIVRTNIVKTKSKDSHSILDHFKFIEKFYKTIPNLNEISTPEEFLNFVKIIHKNITLNSLESAGTFKQEANRVGTFVFVMPEKIEATLKEGFNLGKDIENNFAKALYYHFLISEVHPFEDGNGRTARIILNYHLIKGNYHPLIITEKYRDSYLRGLSEISLQSNPEYYLTFNQLCKERMEQTDFNLETLFEDELDENDSAGNFFDLFGI